MNVTLHKRPRSRRQDWALRRERISEINVTPFVDVLLVLLVIFIVAAPLLSVGVPVNLPETAARPLQSEPEEPVTLTVLADGSVMLMSEPINREELIPKLNAVMGERESDKIYIRGDRDARYEYLMQIMGALGKAGYRNLGLVTEDGGPALDGVETPNQG
ncbi:MAG: biopolymer transporter ExbD [Rhodobacteraceae bacterium]|nr:biopolymer transporter ExbD [Paracoccaceae bacterium]